MKFAPVKIASNMNLAASSTLLASSVQQCLYYEQAVVQAVYSSTGTLRGVVSLQSSLDYNFGAIASTGNWTNIPNASTGVSGSGTFTWFLNFPPPSYLRMTYATSGGDTGSLNAYFSGRGGQ